MLTGFLLSTDTEAAAVRNLGRGRNRGFADTSAQSPPGGAPVQWEDLWSPPNLGFKSPLPPHLLHALQQTILRFFLHLQNEVAAVFPVPYRSYDCTSGASLPELNLRLTDGMPLGKFFYALVLILSTTKWV